jgi:hypothetical protein
MVELNFVVAACKDSLEPMPEVCADALTSVPRNPHLRVLDGRFESRVVLPYWEIMELRIVT